MSKTSSPTQATYGGLDRRLSAFQPQLFGGSLPPCLITMQRHKGAYGYFSGDRFASVGDPKDITDEIALNPAHFASRTPTAIRYRPSPMKWCISGSIISASRRGNGYHNKEWAAKMREIGLIPTDTGQPGGKETGQKVTHMIERGGTFRESLHRVPGQASRRCYTRTGQERGNDPQEESGQQNQVHLPGLSGQRLGEAGHPSGLRRLPRADGDGGGGGRRRGLAGWHDACGQCRAFGT